MAARGAGADLPLAPAVLLAVFVLILRRAGAYAGGSSRATRLEVSHRAPPSACTSA